VTKGTGKIRIGRVPEGTAPGETAATEEGPVTGEAAATRGTSGKNRTWEVLSVILVGRKVIQRRLAHAK
jgi:hypothetical protein